MNEVLSCMLVAMKITPFYGIHVRERGSKFVILFLFILGSFIIIFEKVLVRHFIMMDLFFIMGVGKMVRFLDMVCCITKMVRLLEKENGVRMDAKKQMEVLLI